MARKERRNLEDVMEKLQGKQEEVDIIEETDEEPAVKEGMEDELNKVLAESLNVNWQKKKNKPTKEETHKRVTFLLDRDLNDRLDKLSEAEGRGFKTEFLNEAVRRMLQAFGK